MYRCWILALLLLFNPAAAQDQKVADSLKQILPELSDDSLRYAALYRIIANEGSPEQALASANQLLEIGERIGDPLRIAMAWEETSLAHRRLGNLTQSAKAAMNAQSIYTKEGKTDQLAASHAQLASAWVLEGQYPEAISEYTAALKIYRTVSDTLRQCLTLLNMGEVYRLDEQLDSAIRYFQEALLLNKSADEIVEAYSTGNLGMAYYTQGKTDSARTLLETAIWRLEPLGDHYSVSIYRFELGKLFVDSGTIPVGREIMLQAHATAIREGLKEQVRDFSRELADHFHTHGDFARAYSYQQQYHAYKDSLLNIDNVRRVEQMRGQYQVDQREAEITFLNQLNASRERVLWILGVGALVLALLSLLLYHFYRQKNRANRVLARREEEKALLLRELNHRTKNNLQMISSLLNLQSATLDDHLADLVREGRYRVDSLALIHQRLYQQGFTYIEMDEYLGELISHIGEGFDPEANLETEIEPCTLHVDRAIPLALIVNELLTNAFKYGKNGNGHPEIRVELKRMEHHNRLVIHDRGPGIPESDPAALKSFGLNLVYSLARQLNAELTLDTTLGTQWTLILNNG